MKTLTGEELEKLLIDTDSFYDCPTEEDKKRMREAYREAEAETNTQIQEAGGEKNGTKAEEVVLYNLFNINIKKLCT